MAINRVTHYFACYVFQLTWADLSFTVLIGNVKRANGGALVEKREKLNALVQRVEGLPKIAAWLAKRPETEF